MGNDSENNNKNQSKNQDPEIGQNQKPSSGVIDYIQHANHPWVCFILICFKLSSITSFIILSIFISSTALVYLTVILLACFDFWMTKNVAGRLLVGLRWWNEVKEDGTEVWIFESKNEIKEATSDSRIFWLCVYSAALFWGLLLIYELITFSVVDLIIALVCFIFSATNLYGFFKCSKKQQQNVSKFGAKAALKIVDKGAQFAQNQ